MLGVFKNGLVSPQKELKSPNASQSKDQSPIQAFLAFHENNASSICLGNDASLAFAHSSQSLLASQSCVYHTGGELKSYEHPKNKMKAITRVDSEGAICGANFKVDIFAKTKHAKRW